MGRAFTSKASICLAGLQITLLFASPVLAGTADSTHPSKLLKGNVRTDEEKAANEGLSRSELGLAGPNAGDEKPVEEIEAPTKQQMTMEPVRTPDYAPPPKQALKGNVDDWSKGKMTYLQPSGAPFEGVQEPMPNFQQQPNLQSQVQQNNNDPDNTPEMLLLWDIWHHRVAESIYQRFNFLAKLGFRHSSPLLCEISYVVTRDGHIQNIQIQQKSPNPLFNTIVYQCVNSLNGDVALLTFPQGSHRMFVPKVGTFTQNYGGDGFKYTTGDKETVPGQQLHR